MGWGLVSEHSLPYDAFWVLAGPVACVAIGFPLTFLPRRRTVFWGVWAALSGLFSALYLGYLAYVGLPVFSDPMTLSVLFATVFFAVLLAAIIVIHRTTRRATDSG